MLVPWWFDISIVTEKKLLCSYTNIHGIMADPHGKHHITELLTTLHKSFKIKIKMRFNG